MKDADGRTEIMLAVIEQDLESLKKFLLKYDNVNDKDNLGWTALHYASHGDFLEAAKLLIEKGADVNSIDNYGNNVIWRAVFCSKGKGDLINLLKHNNADFNRKNKHGVNALDLARQIANYDVAQYF